MTEIHDFDDTLVTIFDDRDIARRTVDRLTAAGYDCEVLAGEQGKEHLDPAGEHWLVATVRRQGWGMFFAPDRLPSDEGPHHS